MDLKKLSVGVHMVWRIAAWEVGAARHQYIEKEHILIGICSLEKVVTLDVGETRLTPQTLQALEAVHDNIESLLGMFELDETRLRRQVREKLGQGNYEHIEKIIHRSENCKKVFNRAHELATSGGEISCFHLLAAILEEPGDVIGTIFDEEGVKPAELFQRALAWEIKKQEPNQESVKVSRGETKMVKGGTHYLNRYGRDLTCEAGEGKLGPFVGRRKELLQVIQTLARRTKNNPVLVGEAGVGKTAIVEALALRVVQGKDPHVLAEKRIIELNMGTLVGGSRYRGEFEQRLTGIIEEARNHPEVILFIDEIHNVVGAGRAVGGMDAANLLKPALASGDFRCIGATTISEYRRYIESDSALERRFEKIMVNEPSQNEALEILRGIRPRLEKHHHVKITDRALEAAVDLSIRFDGDHQLPDKAIDLVDKAGARTRIPVLSMRLDRKEGETGLEEGVGFTEVTELTIAHVLFEKTKIPLEVITGHLEGMARSRLLQLEPTLNKRLIGQKKVVKRVSERLLMAHAGLGERRGPLAVFLFLGPTGVGKTELARLLAEYLFGIKSDMIRLDMSEYMEEHSVAKLIGSPPGYVGYKEEGQLTGKMRTNPYAVVLLDEIEKAHPRVLDLFLQVFDEGRLTDSKGRTINARNAIFIMTSNIRTENIRETPPIYDRKKNKGIRERLRRVMRPEFINRIDELLIFKTLSENDVKKILKPMLNEICENLQEQHQVTLRIGEEVERFLVKAGYSPNYGVRELRRTVERLIQIPLSRVILSGDLEKHTNWQIKCSDDEISIIPIGKARARKFYETEPL